jgi:hypothetical protein
LLQAADNNNPPANPASKTNGLSLFCMILSSLVRDIRIRCEANVLRDNLNKAARECFVTKHAGSLAQLRSMGLERQAE